MTIAAAQSSVKSSHPDVFSNTCSVHRAQCISLNLMLCLTAVGCGLQ